MLYTLISYTHGGMGRFKKDTVLSHDMCCVTGVTQWLAQNKEQVRDNPDLRRFGSPYQIRTGDLRLERAAS